MPVTSFSQLFVTSYVLCISCYISTSYSIVQLECIHFCFSPHCGQSICSDGALAYRMHSLKHCTTTNFSLLIWVFQISRLRLLAAKPHHWVCSTRRAVITGVLFDAFPWCHLPMLFEEYLYRAMGVGLYGPVCGKCCRIQYLVCLVSWHMASECQLTWVSTTGARRAKVPV